MAVASDALLPTLVHIPTKLLAWVAPRAATGRDNFQFNNIFDNAAARADLDFRPAIPFVGGPSDRLTRRARPHRG